MGEEDQQAKPWRPASITICCILGFISAALIFLLPFITGPGSVPRWLQLCSFLSATIILACMVGLWHMKKWSIIVFAVYAALHQVFLVAIGTWGWPALVLPAVIVVLGFDHFSKMT
jgi:hypothetical protein